jgi:uncharacterized membrane protein YqjE
MAASRQSQGSGLQTEPAQADKSLGELVAEMTGEISALMRKEVELAKVEIKEEVGRAGKAGGMLGAGAGAGYFALLFVSLALAWLLDQAMPIALAFLIVGVLYGIAAAILIPRGREQMKRVDPVPHRTVETLKEDAAWVRAQKS